jgi:hypothetical protein
MGGSKSKNENFIYFNKDLKTNGTIIVNKKNTEWKLQCTDNNNKIQFIKLLEKKNFDIWNNAIFNSSEDKLCNVIEQNKLYDNLCRDLFNNLKYVTNGRLLSIKKIEENNLFCVEIEEFYETKVLNKEKIKNKIVIIPNIEEYENIENNKTIKYIIKLEKPYNKKNKYYLKINDKYNDLLNFIKCIINYENILKINNIIEHIYNNYDIDYVDHKTVKSKNNNDTNIILSKNFNSNIYNYLLSVKEYNESAKTKLFNWYNDIIITITYNKETITIIITYNKNNLLITKNKCKEITESYEKKIKNIIETMIDVKTHSDSIQTKLLKFELMRLINEKCSIFKINSNIKNYFKKNYKNFGKKDDIEYYNFLRKIVDAFPLDDDINETTNKYNFSTKNELIFKDILSNIGVDMHNKHFEYSKKIYNFLIEENYKNIHLDNTNITTKNYNEILKFTFGINEISYTIDIESKKTNKEFMHLIKTYNIILIENKNNLIITEEINLFDIQNNLLIFINRAKEIYELLLKETVKITFLKIDDECKKYNKNNTNNIIKKTELPEVNSNLFYLNTDKLYTIIFEKESGLFTVECENKKKIEISDYLDIFKIIDIKNKKSIKKSINASLTNSMRSSTRGSITNFFVKKLKLKQ